LQTAIIVRSVSMDVDGIIFSNIARQLACEPLETLRAQDQHPGFPAMLLAAHRVAAAVGYGDEPEPWIIGGRTVGFVVGVLSVALVWLLARELFDVRVANVGAFVFAVLPIPRWVASDALSDTPHLTFYLLAAWLAARGLAGGRLLPLAGAGAAAACAYWIRPEGLEVCGVALACVALQGFRAGWTWRRLTLLSAVLTGTALAIAAPYPMLAGKLTSKQLPGAIHKLAQFFSKAPPPAAGVPGPAASTVSAGDAPREKRAPWRTLGDA